MKKIFLAGMLLMASAPAFCDTSGIVSSNNQFAVDLVINRMDYTEIGDGAHGSSTGILDTEKGGVPGYSATASYMGRDSRVYLQLGTSYLSGDTNYTGAILGSKDSYGSLVGVSTATLLDFSGRAGKGYRLGDSAMLTPYAELGWHLWHRGVNYGETYSYYHYGLGLLGQLAPVDRLVLSAHLLAGRTFDSYIDVKGYFGGPLGDSAYSNAGVAADVALERRLHARLALDITRFRFGRSGFYPLGGKIYWEPDSISRYLTFRIGLSYEL